METERGKGMTTAVESIVKTRVTRRWWKGQRTNGAGLAAESLKPEHVIVMVPDRTSVRSQPCGSGNDPIYT
jgi:hypothetical protein